jgi:hypothetical protein
MQHRQQRMNCDDDADQTKLTRGLDALTCGLDAIVSRIRRWRLLIGFLGVSFIGFVMADNAPSDSADLAMACHMARDAPNDSAFDTSLRLGGGSERHAQNGGTKDQRLHRDSPKKPAAASIRLAVIGSQKRCDMTSDNRPGGRSSGPAAEVTETPIAGVIQPSRLRQPHVNQMSWTAH